MFCVSRNACKMIIFAHSKCKRYENRKIQGVALPYIDCLTCALAKAHVLFLVLHYCYDSHHVLRLVVGLVADLRISQSSVVPKRLHCPWADDGHHRYPIHHRKASQHGQT